ncbi:MULTISPECIES: TIR domain-containing protein [Paenibacillus]|uniref:TIR domain-containing protein n=1 Tax=Paenibacillus TaxID=44249 RepID=UPI0022B8BADB|nr:TIR domain-containing protein [Paenibacillus caseinilyticus]MCZ8522499.1 TIR domain-containing protein [Paenibacillus caseinilyticus]
MPAPDTNRVYTLYLSHTWNYRGTGGELLRLLQSADGFRFRTASLDTQSAAAMDERLLYEAIRSKIRHTDAILIMCGVYAEYNRWVNKELIIGSNELHKPIIGVQPFAPETTSLIVKGHADRLVPFHPQEMIGAITELC